jgi:hypothetical protein
VGRVTGDYLVCGFDIGGCVVIELEEGQVLVKIVNWILLNV